MLRNRAFLSELLGKTAATVQNKRHEKDQLWLILLMTCYTNVTVWSLSPVPSGQLRMTSIAHLSTQIFEVTRKD